ncbi:1-acyl-sn-glycerol-3-phosphate acyltransferase [Acholeplasma sp. OttesenSCG-928-E16]|nr:1-acyl-sn-glycerol-3-phosphate acyltransferase [Acholeplasma sp. OttesenSCG-928-E16]
MNKLEYKRRHKLVYDYVKVTKLWVMNLFLRPKYYYEDKEIQQRKINGGAIVICNHQSWIDVVQLLLVFKGRRLRFLIAKEATKNKLAGLFLRCFGGIPIDRSRFDIEAINNARYALKNGEIVVVFPEGHINSTGVLNQFRSGVSVLSMTTNTKIIPVYAIKRDKWYQRKKVIIGKPVYPENMEGSNPYSLGKADYISTYLFNKMSELKEIMDDRSLLGRKNKIMVNEERI